MPKKNPVTEASELLFRVVDLLSPVASDASDSVLRAAAQIAATLAGVVGARANYVVREPEQRFDASDYERPVYLSDGTELAPYYVAEHVAACICPRCKRVNGVHPALNGGGR